MHNLLLYVIFLMLYCGVLKCFEQYTTCSEDTTKESCLNPAHTMLTLKKRDDNLAKEIARAHGMYVKGRPFFESSYLIEHKDKDYYREKRSTIFESIKKYPDVVSVTSHYVRERARRDYLYRNILKRSVNPKNKNINNTKKGKKNNVPFISIPFNDPYYQNQWYLNGKFVSGFDMNIDGAWLMGYTGKNVTVAVVDNGLQIDHPDLVKNYDPMASIDIEDGDDDPSPYGDIFPNSHGTKCAGVIASAANNNICGVGVAFNSKIGGIKLGGLYQGDLTEAIALSFKPNHIDIYSSSWGATDNGLLMEGAGPLLKETFYNGTKNGRNGKGSIYVWASGNGGKNGDSCSADSYVTSIHTLAIGSVTYNSKVPFYGEKCPAIIASTFSATKEDDSGIVSTSPLNGCTFTFGGSSASAPMASGIIALGLEANPLLTWRDVQHITIRTANPKTLLNNTGWRINGVGRKYSDNFGYGLMDAGALVKLAKVWKTVPKQHLCSYKYKMPKSSPTSVSGKFQINFTIDANECLNGQTVIYLEHVQVISNIKYPRRGNLRLTLFSPKGTKSVILPIRPKDSSENGIKNWPFLSMQMWGEDPRGIWTLMIESIATDKAINGTIHDWELLLYGTEKPAQPTDPKHASVKNSPHKKVNINAFYQWGFNYSTIL